MYKSIKVEKDKVRVFFDNADNGLMVKGIATPSEFYIAGEDRSFVPAQGRVEKNTVIVSSRLVKKPVAVRYGFNNSSIPNLFNKEGFPVNLFRTDDWPVNTDAVKK